MMGWNPIETAPKNGKYILLRIEDKFGDEDEVINIVGCWWEGWCMRELSNSYGHFRINSAYRPTHWCEIPKVEGNL